MASRRIRAVVALLCVALAPSACSRGSRSTYPTPSANAALSNWPSDYMAQAVLQYNDALAHHDRPPYFAAVRSEGRTWTGDPRYYERLCGARITNADGTVVDVLADGPYFDLVHDPRRWSTFNAWLQDPAIYSYIAEGFPDMLEDYSQGRAVGSTAACPAFHSVAPPPIPRH